MPLFIGLGIAGVIYGSVVALKQKDLKRLLAYSSLAHVGLIAAGCYTLTADGMVGAVLQMMAHGFVVIGLFFAAEVIYRRYQTREISQMGGIRIQSAKFASMFLVLVLASVALPSTFNFVGEFMVLFGLSQVNMVFAVLGGLTIILGAWYMLRMFQRVMLGEANPKMFADVTFSEGAVFVAVLAVLLFFGFYTKPLTELISPSIDQILTNINRYQL
jgi:NADH-quinone oxidoreductase subunit M